MIKGYPAKKKLK